MTLSEKGWFKNLISTQAVTPGEKVEDKNEYLYKTTHSSGLIYGHPVLPKEYKNPKFLEETIGSETSQRNLLEVQKHPIDNRELVKAKIKKALNIPGS